MELFDSKIKKLLIFSQKKKLFLYFQEWNPALLSPGSKNETVLNLLDSTKLKIIWKKITTFVK